MVRAMSYYEPVRKENVSSPVNYYDINSVVISGRVASTPKLRSTYTNKINLDFRLAYKKGNKHCYIDVVVINNVKIAEDIIKQGTYVVLYGFLNERIMKGDEEGSEWTETNLLVDRFQVVRPLGDTPEDVYDTSQDYDE